MRLQNSKKWFVDLVSAALVLVFLYTAFSKLQDITRFALTIKSFPVIQHYATSISIAIPTIEILISILLIIPMTKNIGLWSSLILMLAFTGYIVYLLFTASRLPCGCGGVISTLNWSEHLVFNSAIILLIILAMIIMKKELIMINRSSRTPAK